MTNIIAPLQYRIFNKLIIDAVELGTYINNICGISPDPDFGWERFVVHLDMGMGNDSFFDVDTREPLGAAEIEDFYEWRQAFDDIETDRPECYMTPTILKILSALELLPRDQYRVEISW